MARESFSKLFERIDEARENGMTGGNFISGLFKATIVEPAVKGGTKFRDYINESFKIHNDNLEIPVNMKTCLGDNFISLYGGYDNSSTPDTKTIADANGNNIEVLDLSKVGYDTEMYTLMSCSWGTMDKIQLSDSFQVAYEVSLLTKKYADKYVEYFEIDPLADEHFKDMVRNDDAYKAAWAEFSSNAENRVNYNNDDEMRKSFDADYFKSSNAVPWMDRIFGPEKSQALKKDYNDKITNEYTEQLARYKEYCLNKGIDWNNLMQRVSDEMQAECYNYDKSARHLISAVGNDENVSRRGFLMTEAVMRSEGQDVKYSYYGEQYGEDKFHSVINRGSHFCRIVDYISEKWKAISEALKNSVILHPVDKILRPAAKGLDNMMDKFESNGVIKKDDDEISL